MLHCGRYALQPYFWGQDLSASIWRPKLRLWQRWTGSQVGWEWGLLLFITTYIFTILLEPEIWIELWFSSVARANLATDHKIFIWMGIHLHESNTNIHFICHNLVFVLDVSIFRECYLWFIEFLLWSVQVLLCSGPHGTLSAAHTIWTVTPLWLQLLYWVLCSWSHHGRQQVCWCHCLLPRRWIHP